MDEKKKDREVEASKILTVADLEAVYPALVKAVRDEVVERIGKCSAKAVKENMPELYERVSAGIRLGKRGADLSKPGFLLEEFRLGPKGRADKNEGDPFSEGILDYFMRLKGIDGLRLPFVLAFDDPFSKPALEHYVLISSGAGDQVRADAGRAALKKCK